MKLEITGNAATGKTRLLNLIADFIKTKGYATTFVGEHSIKVEMQAPQQTYSVWRGGQGGDYESLPMSELSDEERKQHGLPSNAEIANKFAAVSMDEKTALNKAFGTMSRPLPTESEFVERAAKIVENIHIVSAKGVYGMGEASYELDRAAKQIRALLVPFIEDKTKPDNVGSQAQWPAPGTNKTYAGFKDPNSVAELMQAQPRGPGIQSETNLQKLGKRLKALGIANFAVTMGSDANASAEDKAREVLQTLDKLAARDPQTDDAHIQPKQNDPAHVLWKNGDDWIPDAIRDSNGCVVLALCKRCGKGECELVEPCTPATAPPLSNDEQAGLKMPADPASVLATLVGHNGEMFDGTPANLDRLLLRYSVMHGRNQQLHDGAFYSRDDVLRLFGNIV